MRYPIKMRHLHARAVRTSRPLRYLLTLFVCVILGFAWLTGNYNIAGIYLKRYEQRISQLYRQYQETMTALSEGETLTRDIAELSREYEARAKKCSLKQHDSMDVMTLARQANLSFENCLATSKKENDWCSKQCLQAGFSGTMPQIVHFFEGLQSLANPITCKTISMTRSHDHVFRVQCSLQVAKAQQEPT